MAVQPDGKVLLGGSPNSSSPKCLARLLPDGSKDEDFNQTVLVDGTVMTIVVQPDGKILIGGQFEHVGGVPRSAIARLNSDGTLDAGFDPGTGVTGFSGHPWPGLMSIALQRDGKILIGGGFEQYNGQARCGLTRLNSNGTLDASFDPQLCIEDTVKSVLLQADGKVLVGGDFLSVNNPTINARGGIARLNADGSVDGTFGARWLVFVDYPYSVSMLMADSILLQPDGKVVAAGSFGGVQDLIAGTYWERKGIARFNADGTLDTSFNPGSGVAGAGGMDPIKRIACMAQQPDGKILAGGYFDAFDSIPRSSLVRLLNDVKGFADTNRPALSITNLTAGQRLSNAVFTAKGTATDNWQVASVQYQLNGGIWTTATGTANWSAPLTLTPGTNTFAVYATDTTGNNSTTNRVSFQFVVTNLLAVRTMGLGSISPNYANAWLEIGRNYSMTATPATGFVVTNWTFSTNWVGARITNNATVQFMMASNLTLQVNFADVTKPSLKVTSPTFGQRMTNALATVIGTASDNWKVEGVWYQLNGGPWSLASTANSFTNWTTKLTLVAGTNTVRCYAVDSGRQRFLDQLSEPDFQQHFQAATRLRERSADAYKWAGCRLAVISRLERTHSGVNKSGKLDNADKFRRDQFHPHLPRSGSNEL